jgi:hypothetical protein
MTTTNETATGRPEEIGVRKGQTQVMMEGEAIQLHMTMRAEEGRLFEESYTMIRVGIHDSS